jgi:pimeloyl-ACP methyl ester carboxylesterase
MINSKYLIPAILFFTVGMFADCGNKTQNAREASTQNVRPQEPSAPCPYRVEDVVFDNTRDSVRLAGTLTLPKAEGVFPAAILISGSGSQDRDETLAGHKPFLVIADYLTRNGIAVLRYDDRGVGASGGNPAGCTSEDFSFDAEAALRYLQTRREIAQDKIGFIGHSEGGLIAPMIAARNRDAAFVVLLAGPGIRGDSVLLLQTDAISKSYGIPEAMRKISWNTNRKLYSLTMQATDNAQLEADAMQIMRQASFGATPDERLKQQIAILFEPWIRFFLKYDPLPTLAQVQCPVLALNGSKDLQILPKENLEGIEQALKTGGNKNVTVKTLSGLNHLFQECETGLPTEYEKIEQTFSPVALSETVNWIKKL